MHILELLYLIALLSSIIAFNYKLPGNFFVFIHTVWYKLLSGNPKISNSFLILLFLFAFGLELLEYMIIVFAMRRLSASKYSIWFAVTGSILGSIVGVYTYSVMAGAIIGGFAGVIIGTTIGELIKGKSFDQIIKSIGAAFFGMVGGMVVKYIGVVSIISLIVYKLYL